jgi:putative PIN family toxin of toxin-antitoxin system
MKAVFDTNIFISAFLIPGSQGEQAFLLARRKHVDLYTSVAILAETAQTLRQKFHQEEADITAALKLIGRAAEVLRPDVKITTLKDVADNRILECAVAGDADVIVTGDRALLALKSFGGIAIMRLADFLRLFPQTADES